MKNYLTVYMLYTSLLFTKLKPQPFVKTNHSVKLTFVPKLTNLYVLQPTKINSILSKCPQLITTNTILITSVNSVGTIFVYYWLSSLASLSLVRSYVSLLGYANTNLNYKPKFQKTINSPYTKMISLL